MQRTEGAGAWPLLAQRSAQRPGGYGQRVSCWWLLMDDRHPSLGTRQENTGPGRVRGKEPAPRHSAGAAARHSRDRGAGRAGGGWGRGRGRGGVRQGRGETRASAVGTSSRHGQIGP